MSTQTPIKNFNSLVRCNSTQMPLLNIFIVATLKSQNTCLTVGNTFLNTFDFNVF